MTHVAPLGRRFHVSAAPKPQAPRWRQRASLYLWRAITAWLQCRCDSVRTTCGNHRTDSFEEGNCTSLSMNWYIQCRSAQCMYCMCFIYFNVRGDSRSPRGETSHRELLLLYERHAYLMPPAPRSSRTWLPSCTRCSLLRGKKAILVL